MKKSWEMISVGKQPKLKNPVLVEGLPGIGNVGKVAVDYIIDQVDAKKLYDVFSYTFPHSVFINENHLVELPSIAIYHKRIKGQDVLFLSGDVQPVDEVSAYQFSEAMLDLVLKYGGKEVVTLGGIGLPKAPKKPKLYCTGSNEKIVNRYKQIAEVNSNLYGVVGPIIGVSGLLVGLAKRRGMNGVALLAETFGHPMHLGMDGAKVILDLLNKRFELGLNLKKLDEEIKLAENSIKSEGLKAGGKEPEPNKPPKDFSYIG